MSEPAPRQDDVIEKAARALDLLAEHTFSHTTDPQNAGCDSDEEPCTCGMPVSDWTCHHVDVLAKAGLLADPAQTTELEKERRRSAAFEKQWMETQAELDDRQRFLRDVVAERDERQARIDRAKAALQVEGDDLTDWHAGYRAACERGLAALAGDQPTEEDTP